jgi:hypothetical protein
LVDGLVVQYQSEVWVKSQGGGGGGEEIEQSQLKQEQVESIDELVENCLRLGGASLILVLMNVGITMLA